MLTHSEMNVVLVMAEIITPCTAWFGGDGRASIPLGCDAL